MSAVIGQGMVITLGSFYRRNTDLVVSICATRLGRSPILFLFFLLLVLFPFEESTTKISGTSRLRRDIIIAAGGETALRPWPLLGTNQAHRDLLGVPG